MKAQIDIRDYVLAVHLGWGEAERSQSQDVSLSLRFVDPPKACVSDKLEDTVCYHHLTQLITQYCQSHQYPQSLALLPRCVIG